MWLHIRCHLSRVLKIAPACYKYEDRSVVYAWWRPYITSSDTGFLRSTGICFPKRHLDRFSPVAGFTHVTNTDRQTEHRDRQMCDICSNNQNLVKFWTCGLWDILVDRQTDRQTDTVVATLHTLTRVRQLYKLLFQSQSDDAGYRPYRFNVVRFVEIISALLSSIT